MAFYVQVNFSTNWAVEPKSMGIVEKRAEATEVGWADALLLQERARKLRRDLAWQIDRTYSNKYVVRGQRNVV